MAQAAIAPATGKGPMSATGNRPRPPLRTPTPSPATLPTQPLPKVVQGCPYLALIVPSDEGELQAQAMENWFQACSSDEPFALELVGTRREQGFVLRASSQAQFTFLCKQFEAQYPQADIQPIAPTADPLLLKPGECAAVGEFTLTRPSWMPLKVFQARALTEPGGDPLANLLAAMEPVESGERIISQLALIHAPDDWIAPGIRKAVEHPLQKERDQFASSLKGSSGSDTGRGWRIVLSLFLVLAALWGYRWYQQGAVLPLALPGSVACLLGLAGLLWWIRHRKEDIYDMKLVADKLLRSAFSMHLRVIVVGQQATSTEEQLRERLKGMEIAYRQFSLASANSLALKRVHILENASCPLATTLCQAEYAFPRRRAWWRFLYRLWSSDTCNGLELSGLFHLPQQLTDLPLVKRISIKHLLFSPEVSHAIEQSEEPLPPVSIGFSKHRSFAVRVLLPYLTQFSHMFIMGRSRTGKTILLQLLVSGVLQRVRNGGLQPGIFCIDPHRDLIFDILKLIPKRRANDVLLLDFTDSQHVVGLNPLDATVGLSRDQMIASLMSCFERVWEKYWGPRMSHFLKNICLLLVTLNFQLCDEGRANEQYTLLDINPILQYKDYATLVLNQLDRSETWHQELLAWFQHTYWSLPEKSSLRQEIILPILSKMSTFNDNMQLRRIFGQSITSAPVHEAITQGKIVLCALSSRDMDEASVNILGSTLINTLHYAFTRQQDTPLMQRRKCRVFIDELQNFSGSQFSKLLSEDAKWGCGVVMTTQNLKRLNQIQEGLQEMLFGNCENLFAFNVSAADAKLLETEFQERVTQKHIISQPRLHCYARLAIPDVPIQFASVRLHHPASWNASAQRERVAEYIQQRNQQRFMHAALCDHLHAAHLKKFMDVSLFADRIEKDALSIESHRKDREAAHQAPHVETETQQPTAHTKPHAQASNTSVAVPSPAPQPAPVLSASVTSSPGSQPPVAHAPASVAPPGASATHVANGMQHKQAGQTATNRQKADAAQGQPAAPVQTPSSSASQQQGTGSSEENRGRQAAPGGQPRGHRRVRSRHMNKKNKQHVGLPPPGLEEDRHDEHIFSTDRYNNPHWGAEGRERERGA